MYITPAQQNSIFYGILIAAGITLIIVFSVMWSNCKDKYNRLKIEKSGDDKINDKLIKKAEVDGCYNACLAGMLLSKSASKTELYNFEETCNTSCTTKRKCQQKCLDDYTTKIIAYPTTSGKNGDDQTAYTVCAVNC
jgi:hypothetical protein